jgi:N-acetylglucosamine-6-phosphate deacetylase
MNRLTLLGGVVPTEFLHGRGDPNDGAPSGFRRAQLDLVAGRIESLSLPSGTPGGACLDATGCTVLPGFMDVHVHGAAGRDTMDASQEALADMARFYARHGVTGFLATTMTAPYDAIARAVQTVGLMPDQVPGGARILGVHLEGPYLSPEFPGAQPADTIRPPNADEFADLAARGPVRMITLAPERPGAHDLIRAALERDVVVVAGHTSATYEECEAAFALGVSQATHTYNAMTGLHHRRPGTLGATLANDAIFAQLIADNIHVHPAAIKILARAKGVARTVLITDAMRAAGLPDGDYDLGGQTVTVRDSQCRLTDGTLAGSVLTMDRALANFMHATDLPLAAVWPASSRTPATSLGLDGELGSLMPGYRADLVLLDRDHQVVATVVGGDITYLRDESRFRPSPRR